MVLYVNVCRRGWFEVFGVNGEGVCDFFVEEGLVMVFSGGYGYLEWGVVDSWRREGVGF